MKKIFTKEWFQAAAIRALKTVAQTAVATIGTAALIVAAQISCKAARGLIAK